MTHKLHSEEDLQGFLQLLCDWYSDQARELPWRKTKNPYRIWISEIMLQQTQVATVLDYYRRFLERFPDVDSLARADEQDVLSLWSGLGYYRRARQLHAAAKEIVQVYGGRFPRKLDQVLALPGIGRYTAGAITSFAFNQANPIVEANTIRLYSRLLLLRDPTSTSTSQHQLWSFAEHLLSSPGVPSPSSRLDPRLVNQAVMELGSQICTPRQPACLLCPVSDYCPSFEQGLQHSIPKPKEKKAAIEQYHALVVIKKRGRYLLRQNGADEWWEGLWDFPRTKIPKKLSISESATPKSELAKPGRAVVSRTKKYSTQLEEEFLSSLQLECSIREWLKYMQHGVTKYRIRLDCWEAELPAKVSIRSLPGKWKWCAPAELSDKLPLTSTAAKLFDWLYSRLPSSASN